MLIENIVLQAAEENAYKYLDIHAQSKEPDNILILGWINKHMIDFLFQRYL